MKILKSIRVGRTVYNFGDEQKMLDRAAAYPEQLDFFRLLNMGCIDEIPVVETLSPELKEQHRKEIEAAELQKIETANQIAADDFAKKQKAIADAHARQLEKQRRQKLLQDQEGTDLGEGAESVNEMTKLSGDGTSAATEPNAE